MATGSPPIPANQGRPPSGARAMPSGSPAVSTTRVKSVAITQPQIGRRQQESRAVAFGTVEVRLISICSRCAAAPWRSPDGPRGRPRAPDSSRPRRRLGRQWRPRPVTEEGGCRLRIIAATRPRRAPRWAAADRDWKDPVPERSSGRGRRRSGSTDSPWFSQPAPVKDTVMVCARGSTRRWSI